jgi:hypothetical protein
MVDALESLQGEFSGDKVSPKSPSQVSGAINKAFLGLPADQQKRWLPTFGSWWTTQLRDQWDGGKLVTKEDWILFIDETLTGLKAVL